MALPDIKLGSDVIYPDVKKHKIGDIIRFRFQSHAKKLLIDLVRIWKSLWPNSRFKNEHIYEIDLKDKVNYFPVVQSMGDDVTEAHLVT